MAREQPLETLGVAIEAFLARADLAASSRRSYTQTLVSRGAQLPFVSRPTSAETEAGGR
ncbi:MAG: hypothetical protein WBP81_10055 [Solirubrobacteraceae bacterium]